MTLFQKIAGDLMIMAVLILIADVMAVMIKRIRSVVLKDAYKKVFRAEMMVLSAMLLSAVDIRTGFLGNSHGLLLKAAGTFLRIMLILFAAIREFFMIKIAFGEVLRSGGDTGCAIVLGMALMDGKPSGDLLLRVRAAGRYMDEHPDAFLIVSGGNPDAQGKTEAMIMKELLVKGGADCKRIRLENSAGTTDENFICSAAMTDPLKPTAVITSGYHMERALRSAKKAGFTDIRRYPARSRFLTYGASVMWETVLILNDLIR